MRSVPVKDRCRKAVRDASSVNQAFTSQKTNLSGDRGGSEASAAVVRAGTQQRLSQSV